MSEPTNQEILTLIEECAASVHATADDLLRYKGSPLDHIREGRRASMRALKANGVPVGVISAIFQVSKQRVYEATA